MNLLRGDWRVSFAMSELIVFVVAILAWGWFGPFIGMLTTVAAFAFGAMWSQGRIEVDEADKHEGGGNG